MVVCSCIPGPRGARGCPWWASSSSPPWGKEGATRPPPPPPSPPPPTSWTRTPTHRRPWERSCQVHTRIGLSIGNAYKSIVKTITISEIKTEILQLIIDWLLSSPNQSWVLIDLYEFSRNELFAVALISIWCKLHFLIEF